MKSKEFSVQPELLTGREVHDQRQFPRQPDYDHWSEVGYPPITGGASDTPNLESPGNHPKTARWTRQRCLDYWLSQIGYSPISDEPDSFEKEQHRESARAFIEAYINKKWNRRKEEGLFSKTLEEVVRLGKVYPGLFEDVAKSIKWEDRSEDRG